jgi:S-(hydroxymethyl)glutathione dehydrogenase/alcohol dehydrogenase
MLTKGALLWGVGKEWSVEEIDIGEPHWGEVQVRLAASGLCHSDEHLTTGDSLLPSFPVLGGHEGAGVVTKVGPGVTSLVEGDHVVLAFIPSCGKCPSCASGQQSLCDDGARLLTGRSISDDTFRVQAQGHDVIPMCLLGTFAPYVTVHEYSTVKIDKDLPLDKAALVGCGVTTGWGTAVHVADVKPGETVAVIGVGGVGINAVQGAAQAGAGRIIAIDPVAFKRDQAMKFGATHAYASIAEAAPAISEMTLGRNATKVMITVGRVDGPIIGEAQTILAKAGRIVVTSVGHQDDSAVTLNMFMLTLMQQDLQGAIFGGGNPRVDIPLLLDLYRNGRLNLDDLVTTTYTLEQINQGYADMRAGKNLRGVITYSDSDY